MSGSRTPPSVLLVECTGRSGLVHAITGGLVCQDVNVVGNQEFVDRPSARFYMRTEFDGTVNSPALLTELRAVLPPGAEVRLSHLEPKRVVVLASKEHHCLADILVRHSFKELNAHVLAVRWSGPALCGWSSKTASYCVATARSFSTNHASPP